jgi:hypothetical protein
MSIKKYFKDIGKDVKHQGQDIVHSAVQGVEGAVYDSIVKVGLDILTGKPIDWQDVKNSILGPITGSPREFNPYRGISPFLFMLKASNGFQLMTSCVENGFTLPKTASFGSTTIMNRSSEILTYSHTGNATLDFEVKLYAFKDAKTEVMDIINELYQLVLPVEPGIKPPPSCRITVPYLLNDWQCVCTSVTPSFTGDTKTWTLEGYPMSASVRLTFTELSIYNTPAINHVKNNDPNDKSNIKSYSFMDAIRYGNNWYTEQETKIDPQTGKPLKDPKTGKPIKGDKVYTPPNLGGVAIDSNFNRIYAKAYDEKGNIYYGADFTELAEQHANQNLGPGEYDNPTPQDSPTPQTNYLPPQQPSHSPDNPVSPEDANLPTFEINSSDTKTPTQNSTAQPTQSDNDLPPVPQIPTIFPPKK